MIFKKSSIGPLKRVIQSGFSTKIRVADVKVMSILLIISLTVLTSAVPIVALLSLFFNISTCVVMAMLWSTCVTIYMWAAYVYPDYYRTFATG